MNGSLGLGSSPRRSGRILISAAVSLLLVGLTSVAAWKHWSGTSRRETHRGAQATVTADELDATRAIVEKFCGDCHAVPLPGSFPKAAWPDEVQRGYQFYADSGRRDLEVPRPDLVLDYFRNLAPVTIDIGMQADKIAPSPVSFSPGPSPLGSGSDHLFVSAVQWGTLIDGEPSTLLACDMWTNQLMMCRPERDGIVLQELAHFRSPAHVTRVDLDKDGRLDLVVSELGQFRPDDHSDGQVTWLRSTNLGGFDPLVLKSGIGRVADVQPADFDGDGDFDLIVAEFGWHATGSISLLENHTEANGPPAFEWRVIDRRTGTIHVPVADLNGDGRPDFVALVSQEHECVDLFLNKGDGTFDRRTIFNAHDPAFGSSGIELVDLDRDGDLDILYSNGDTFDSFYLNPKHGIRWLENRGEGAYEVHELILMPGVHRALAGDIDGDGDLDIAACSLFPRELKGRLPAGVFDSVLWLEQTDSMKFIRHSIEQKNCTHAALELGDFDNDGRLDIAVGGFGDVAKQPSLTIWWNGSSATKDRKEAGLQN